MCGIAGFNWCDEHLAKRMTDALAHRGPDDEGVFVDEGLSLGHRRLSILDLSELGRQPMPYERGGRHAVITYNGEIYNFREIRRLLEEKGYRFRTGTDTEVILGSYLEWGPDCVLRFNGMWAFAIYDQAEKKILLSRDRFGEKPLYYWLTNGRLIFASEIKAILTHRIPRKADREAISDYLFKDTVNHRLTTFFQDIRMLPPAHNAVFDLATGNLSLNQYYEPSHGNRRVSADEFREMLGKSVQRRLVSDVPISISLSSGVDSPSIAALTADCTDATIKAFSTATEQGIGDETTLLQHFLTRYPQFELEKTTLSESSFCQHYREIIYHMDEPFVRQSAYVRWEIAHLTHRHDRKVLLNGEGADEILGGYTPFSARFLHDLLRHFRLIRLAQELSATVHHPERKKIHEAYRSTFLFSGASRKRREHGIAQRRKKFGIRIEPTFEAAPAHNNLKDYLFSLVHESSLPRLLNCNDKMTMANSVEGRAPFLDHEFVDLAFSMDTNDLVYKGWRKYPLRRAMQGRVPDAILFRKEKEGFLAPIFEYLRNISVQARIRDIFRQAKTECIFNPKAYLGEYERFLERRGADPAFLLHGLFLEEWARMFEVELSDS